MGQPDKYYLAHTLHMKPAMFGKNFWAFKGGELLIYTKIKVIYIYMTVVKKKYKSREKKSIQIAMVVEIYTLVNNLYNK